MKWNSNNVIHFLKIYEQYPVLWNMKHTDYCNLKLKDDAFKELYEKLERESLVEGMDEIKLKCKIRNLKDVYIQELGKIERSRKNGKTEDIYKPKLMWFYSAGFFQNLLTTRNRQLNWDYSNLSQVKRPDGLKDSQIQEFVDKGSIGGHKRKSSISSEISPFNPAKKCKSREAPEITDAIRHLTRIAQKTDEEKPYDQFAKYVATELRQLPQRQAILLQQEIQNSVTRVKLSCLDPMPSADP